MSDLFIVEPGDADAHRQRRQAEAAAVADVRARWTTHAAEETGVAIDVVQAVLSVLFDREDLTKSEGTCGCGCHPRFTSTHAGGFECNCTKDPDQRRAERDAAMQALRDDPATEAVREREHQELADTASWIAAHPGVTAERTVMACPEIWEGQVDGRSFFFRERGGEWRIELDLAPNGRFAKRVGFGPDGHLLTGPDGEWVTEPIELTSGTVIARGLDDDLGDTPTEHLAFVVATIRDHLRREDCRHPDAKVWCPDCGERME